MNDSLQLRESLLAATAQASRLLLEAPAALVVMPEVLRLFGTAAQVDRTTFALAEACPDSGERWLVIRSEWTSDGIASEDALLDVINGARRSDCYCADLQTGRSVIVLARDACDSCDTSIASGGALSSVIVPVFVDGTYTGAIGFEAWSEAREFDSAIVSSLEIAAGLIGAALHRERLVETMRREREHAAEARVAELARANAVIRSNLAQLASQPDLHRLLDHMLLEITRQLEAAAGGIAVLDEAADEWTLVAFAHEGRIIVDPPVGKRASKRDTAVTQLLTRQREPEYFELDRLAQIGWTNSAEFHRAQGHQSFYALPLVFGERTIGLIGLAFRERQKLTSERTELLVALAQQITLAISLKRLAMSAKKTAVLAERNRIGQEIHDGLAQAFTGIIMQLGAAEEHMGCALETQLPAILGRVRDLAREGLAEARRSVLALKPDEDRVVGLAVALAQLAERSTIAGRTTCTFDGGFAGTGPAPEQQHELLRIAQEAVINAVRHAHPSTIRIVLLEEPGRWTLSVIDNGRGMEELPEPHVRQGFGLENMRERALAIGGEFAIQSHPRQGTRVIVTLPRP